MTKLDVQEMDLRFNQRVLGFHVYVNTDRDHAPIAKQIQRAAKGPRLDGSVMWLEGYGDGREAWKEMIAERERDAAEQAGSAISGVKWTNPPDLRPDCLRVLVFHLFVNTDADPYHIHKALLRIARGDRLDACVCWAELYEGEDGRKIWTEIQKVAAQLAANPNAKPYSIRD